MPSFASVNVDCSGIPRLVAELPTFLKSGSDLYPSQCCFEYYFFAKTDFGVKTDPKFQIVSNERVV
jgi:hypothetical protein